MNKIKHTLFLVPLALLLSCGDEGIGFNVSKEVNAPIPVSLPFSSIPYVPTNIDPFWQNLNFNPDGYTETEEYDLSEMVSSDDLEFLDEVIINSMSYEITGLSAAEETNLDEISIVYRNKSTNTILGSIVINNRLQNIPKTTANFDYTALSSALQNQATIEASFTVDFAQLPTTDISFDFVFYFDVLAKIRE